MASKSKFAAAIEDAASKKTSTAFSRGLSETLMGELVNDPDFQLDTIVRSEKNANGYEVQSSFPVRDFRDGLAKSIKSELGIDDAEAEKIKSMHLNKATTSALSTISAVHTDGYLRTGKNFALPMTSPDQSRISIALTEKAEKTEETFAPLLNEKTGKYERTSTGKKVKTSKHFVGKVSNATPAWLKKEV